MTSPTDSARKRPIKRKNLKVKRFRFLKPGKPKAIVLDRQCSRTWSSWTISDLSKSSSSKSPGGSFNNSSQYERGILRKKNRQLAATLNDVRLTNAALCKKVNELNGLNLDLHAEVADLRKEVQGLRLSSVKSRSSEADIHRRQAVSYFRIKLFKIWRWTILGNAGAGFDELEAGVRSHAGLVRQPHLGNAHDRVSASAILSDCPRRRREQLQRRQHPDQGPPRSQDVHGQHDPGGQSFDVRLKLATTASSLES